MNDHRSDGEIVVYGLTTCSTVKKARTWLDDHGVNYRFHDFKTEGLSEELATAWIADLGWEVLLNRRGTTWRRLPPERREQIGEAEALALILENPSIVKRPVIEYPGGRVVGFDVERYSAVFASPRR